jgi:hypothetical protein
MTQTAACVANTAVGVTQTAVAQLIHFQLHAAARRLSSSSTPNPTPAKSIAGPQKGVGGRGVGVGTLQFF